MAKGPIAPCPECGKVISLNFPLHICEPTKNFMESRVIPEASKSETMEETGHESMLERVKAAHKMVTELTPSWNSWGLDWEARPKWMHTQADFKFFENMLLTFECANIKDITVTKRQFFWLRDLFDRSL